jgi:hypothetical protein
MVVEMSVDQAARPRLRPGARFALAGVALDFVLAAGLGAFRTAHGSVGLRHVEGPLPTVAMVVAMAAPGVLALVGIAIDRPILFGAAAFACGPLMIISILAFPFLISCVLLILAFAEAQTSQLSPLFVAALIFVIFPVPIAIGLRILITETREFTYAFPGGSEGGEYFTPAHAVLCIALVAADLAFVSVLARLTAAPIRTPRRPARV